MNIKRHSKKLIKKAIEKSGFELRRKLNQNTPTLSSALCRLKRREVDFNTVIDIGASNGCWSAELMKHFPEVNYLLIEAQPIHEPALKQFCHQHSNAQYVLAAAGAEESKIFFDITDPFGGVASYEPFKQNCISVPVTTVDLQVKRHDLPPPYLLKLDTHGFEIPIFEGAINTLPQANVLIVECYNFNIAPECILFSDMCRYLEGHGFRCVDMYDLLYRPYDESFWQMDILFVKAKRKEFSYTQYQ